jgi:adsorption protein B
MEWAQPLLTGLDLAMREVMLFAAAGFLVLGLGDLLVDLLWAARRLARLGAGEATLRDLKAPARPGLMAVFIPAWDEAAVIGQMLRSTLAALADADYRLYVGCYPNDPGTIAAVRAVADPRVRLVVGARPGPTTKADCLNRLWEALLADEAAEGRRAKAVVLHDAEDVVHPGELRLFNTLIEEHALVQLPVVPLIDENSRWLGGHYADEFAEAHGKELVVRHWLGASVPSAGVGCAFCREALGRLAGPHPFDAHSLTEDYELGLRIKDAGGSVAFVRMRHAPGGALIATREYFPPTLSAAVSQKARWVTGIALLGWDRLGWRGGLAERWMRFRDRQTLVAALLLFAGYGAMLLWLAGKAGEAATGIGGRELGTLLESLLWINLALLCWRAVVRFGFTTSVYGWREGLRAVPRIAVGNLVALLATAKALGRYRQARRTGRAVWHKTAHAFPGGLEAR